MNKKTYRLLASLLLMLVATLTSCEKFSIDETTGKSREANANVTYPCAENRRHKSADNQSCRQADGAERCVLQTDTCHL